MEFLKSKEAQFAARIAARAARLAQSIQQRMVSPALTKGDRSPVTVADFAAQALVGKEIAAAFPDDPLVGEEDSAELKAEGAAETLERITQFLNEIEASATPEAVCQWIDRGNGQPGDRFWTLDPIDGTKGFLRGDQYATAFALIERGTVKLGVLACPNLAAPGNQSSGGSIYVAADGQGCWLASLAAVTADELDFGAFQRVKVSDQRDPQQARILRSYEKGHTDADKTSEIAGRLSVSADPVLMDSQAKYAVLASGGGELLLRLISPSRPDYREKIWDQAAGSLVVREAGGKVTDLDGKPLDFTTGRTLENNRGVVASNGHMHKAVLAAVAEVGA